jgi:transformation/transcription domain-associated protein
MQFRLLPIIKKVTNCHAFFQVAEGYPPNMKKVLLLHFLKLFQSKQLGHDHLVVVMQMLILPMLAHAFQNGHSWEVVDPNIIKTIVDKLLDPPEEVLS